MYGCVICVTCGFKYGLTLAKNKMTSQSCVLQHLTDSEERQFRSHCSHLLCDSVCLTHHEYKTVNVELCGGAVQVREVLKSRDSHLTFFGLAGVCPSVQVTKHYEVTNPHFRQVLQGRQNNYKHESSRTQREREGEMLVTLLAIELNQNLTSDWCSTSYKNL